MIISDVSGLLCDDENAMSIHQAKRSQVLTTSIQIALVDLLRWLQVAPSAVVGHSSGEIAAA